MRFFWSRVECEAAVGSNVRSVPSFFEGCWLLLVAIPVKSVVLNSYLFRLFDGQQCQPGDGQLLPPPLDSGCFSLLHPAKDSNVEKITHGIS